MGDRQFCAIQGLVESEIVLPSGEVLNDDFAIVYIDRDDKGIFRVRADSIGWMSKDESLAMLEYQLKWFNRQEKERSWLEGRREVIRDWILHMNYQSDMYEWLSIKDKNDFLISFGFFSLSRQADKDNGIRYCYKFELKRSKERRNRNFKLNSGAEKSE